MTFLVSFLVLILPALPGASAIGCSPVNEQTVKKLYEAHQWDAVVEAVPSCSKLAGPELYRGLALAQLGRLSAAAEAFRAGRVEHPRDARFSVELAGVDYREKRLSQAKRNLLHAIAIDPHNAYAKNFLASIYFLEGNLEAALKYWNRVGKPKLNNLSFQLPSGLDPQVLGRAFQFSRGSVWRRDQFLSTRLELQSLDLFPEMRFGLEPEPDGAFNLKFRAIERSSSDLKHLIGIASMLRGLPYQSIYPDFYNLNHKGLNWLSFVRWDDEKRRFSSEISSPLGGPKRRFKLYVDARNENWDLANSLLPGSPSSAGVNMRVAVAGATIRSIPGWRWQWNLGGEYSYRDFRSRRAIPPEANFFFTDTSGLDLRAGVSRSLIRIPERRFTLGTHAMADLGKFFSHPLGRHGSIEGELSAKWLPQAQGDDYETTSTLRAGRTFGRVPLDRLFMLGFDRDNPLWMRGHDALMNGRKGNAPLGRSFVLSNSDFSKVLYRGPFIEIKLGPFLDTGDIYDPSGFFGSPKWLADTGLQVTVGVLRNFQFVLGYGRDLRSGKNTFYSTVLE